MKSFLTVFIVLITSCAIAGPIAILSDLPTGRFQGSVVAGAEGQPGSLEIQRDASGMLFTFVPQGAVGETREEWLLQGDRLIQTYFDSSGAESNTVKSKISTVFPVGSNEATFYRHCPGRQCADGNARTIAVVDGKLRYTIWDALITKYKPQEVEAEGGVVLTDAPETTVESAKRMELVFPY